MKFVIFSFIFILLFCSIASASIEVYPEDKSIDLQYICTLNNQIPSASAIFNISIYYPNGTAMIENVGTTPLGSGSFTYTTSFSEQGIYKVKMFCSDGTYSYSDEGSYKINYTGEEISNEQTYVYILALIFLVAVIFGTGFIINILPSADSMDVIGNIIQVSWLKYLRPVLWVFIWGLSLSIVFILSNLGIAYLSNPMIGNLFFVIYQIMFYITIIAVPIYFIWIFVKIAQDKEMQRMINRGIDVQGP